MSIEQQTFLLAEQALVKVINQIADKQWNLPAETIPHWGEAVPTLREIVNRHAFDDAWVPDTLAGKTIEEVGTTYDGDLLGSDPKSSFMKYVNVASASVEALSANDLDTSVHLTYGNFSVREYLQHITVFRGFRAYTIAKFIGVDATLDPALVQGLWEEVIPYIEDWRSMGVFPAPIATSADADMQTKLLGLVGFLQK